MKSLVIANSNTVSGEHYDLVDQKWIEITGGFNQTRYEFQCSNIADAGNVCVNAIQTVEYELDSARSAKHPNSLQVNSNYIKGDFKIFLQGTESDFSVTVDNGSFLSLGFSAKATSWGGYKLVSNDSRYRAALAFYNYQNQGYFDLLITSSDQNIVLTQIPL